MDRFELFSRLCEPNGQLSEWTDNHGRKFLGWCDAVEREDGSGYLFNVKVRKENGCIDWIFVRCKP